VGEKRGSRQDHASMRRETNGTARVEEIIVDKRTMHIYISRAQQIIKSLQ
jgi:hypothetical protein